MLVRERPILLGYAIQGAYSFWLYAFGPAVALLRRDLGFSYAVIGGYSAAWAAGSVIAGAIFVRLASGASHSRLLWATAAATTVGAAVFTLADNVAATLAAAVVMGLAGTLLQTTVQSVLSGLHGFRRDQALVEANIGAAVCAVIAPLAVGGLATTPGTWRSGMALPAVAMFALYLTHRRTRLPAAPPSPVHNPHRPGRLSLACRLLCLLVALGIAVEFCVIYFAAELLTISGLATAQAAMAVTVFYVGILSGRVVGAHLTRRPRRTLPLVAASLALTLVGLIACWLSTTPLIVLAGLLVTGLGIANQFPLALALALAVGPDTDRANAYAQLLGALVLLPAPFLLGALADYTGLRLAFIIPVLLTALSAPLLFVGRTPDRDCKFNGPEPAT